MTFTRRASDVAGRRHYPADAVPLPPSPPPPLPPPPPSTGWNVPVLPVITDYTFKEPILAGNGDIVLGASGWHEIYNANGDVTNAVDLLAPFPSAVVQYRFRQGMTGGNGIGELWRGLGALSKIAVTFWVKVSNPWQGHASSYNKLGYIATNTGSMFMAMHGNVSGPFELVVFPQFPGVSLDQWYLPNVNHVNLTLGVYHKIGWVFDYATGLLQWGMDGVLIGNYSGVPVPQEPLIQYTLDPIWGGSGDVKVETDYMWFNRIVVAGT